MSPSDTRLGVAVVIPVGSGRRENLSVVLGCVERQTVRPVVVVLVADGPEAALGEIAGMTVPLIQVIISKHKPGMTQPRNRGVRAAFRWADDHEQRVNAIWFLDTDILVGDDCLEHYRTAWGAVPFERVLMGPYDWLPPGMRGGDPSLHNDPRWPMFREARWDGGLGTSLGELNVGLGCFSGNLVWPAYEFARVGGFWSEIHHGRCEDGELGLRAVSMGVPIACVPHARGWHLWHPINVERTLACNARDVPMLNERHPWVQGQGVFVVDRDGKRFEQTCPSCGQLVNTIEWWTHQAEHESGDGSTALSAS